MLFISLITFTYIPFIRIRSLLVCVFAVAAFQVSTSGLAKERSKEKHVFSFFFFLFFILLSFLYITFFSFFFFLFFFCFLFSTFLVGICMFKKYVLEHRK